MAFPFFFVFLGQMSPNTEGSPGNIQLSREVRDTYLLLSVSGNYPGKKAGLEFIETLFLQAKNAHLSKVLLDLRAMAGHVQGMDRYEMGNKAGMLWDKSLKVAIVDRPEAINRFFEDVAINRGVNTRVFFTEEEAAGWLISDEIK